MRLIEWLRSRFKKKEEQMDVDTKLAFLKLSSDIQGEAISSLIDSLKHHDEFKSLVANAVTNIDNRVDQLEKMSTFLYEKSSEVDERLDNLDDKITKDEFTQLADRLAPKDT